MVLDKEDHRAILLELIDKAAFPGAVLDTVKELRDTIRAASVEGVTAINGVDRREELPAQQKLF